MKFFTATHYSDYQNDIVTDNDWEDLNEKYQHYLYKLELPSEVTDYYHNINLHDADIDQESLINLHKDRKLVFVQKDYEPNFRATISYTMPFADSTGFITEHQHNHEVFKLTDKPLFLYDEFNSVGHYNGRETFTHSILFSNGLEVTIHFTHFKYELTYLNS